MKNKIITTILATLVLIGLGFFVNKDMNNGVTLTDALSGVSGWITTLIMLLIGKDSHLLDILKKD